MFYKLEGQPDSRRREVVYKMIKKSVLGVGINDADYVVQPTINGKRVRCKVYDTWYDMLKRCYDPKHQEKYPTYLGCSVDKEWHSFMNFRAWMLDQDFEGKQLDKDLLLSGNKVYSKNTCVFISPALNNFITESTKTRGALPLGVSAKGGKFQASCNNPFTKSQKYLGLFNTPEEAHLAWKRYKHELALEYAKLETDFRIIQALRERYLI